MASVWKLKCPIHEEEIVSDKFIPISSDGSVNNEPIFFCEKCGCFYIHTDAVQTGAFFDYGKYKVVNTEVSPEEVIKQTNTEVLCTELSNLKPYTAPFIPDICYKDQEELEYIKYGLFQCGDYKKEISGYYCHECHDFYLDEELYDEIKIELPSMSKHGNENVYDDKEKKKKIIYSVDAIKPKINSLGFKNADDVMLQRIRRATANA